MARNYFQALVRVIFEENDKLLLMKRAKFKGGGYGLVGGHVDLGESPVEALIRETYEEVGLRIKAEDLDLVQVLHRPKPDHEVMHLVFKARAWEGKARNREPKKCETIDWFHWNELPKDLSPSTKVALEKYREGIHYIEMPELP